MSNELLSTVSADEVRRLAELLECGMGCGPTERRAAKTLRALVLERDELAGRARGVEGELAVLEEVQWQDKRAAQPEAVGKPLAEMVNRFLRWKLPADFSPDCGISFKPESDYDHPEFGRTKYEPTGTNLLNYDQARGMLKHVLATTTRVALSTPPAQAQDSVDAERMNWLETMTVNVRVPLRNGSYNLFWAGPDPDDESPSDLRKQIDAAISAKEQP